MTKLKEVQRYHLKIPNVDFAPDNVLMHELENEQEEEEEQEEELSLIHI